MNKLTVLILFALLATLTGCITVSTPDTASLNATVEASVSTAIAPYEEKYGQLVSVDELETSQTEQNQKMQQYIVDRFPKRIPTERLMPLRIHPRVRPRN